MRVSFAWLTVVFFQLAACTEGAQPDPEGSLGGGSGATSGASGSAGNVSGAGSPTTNGTNGAAGSSAGGEVGVAGTQAGVGGQGGAATGGASGAAGTGGAASGGMPGSGGNLPVDRDLPGKIVVLGSSTSAGTGPKDPKNAYVVRYQAYLAQQFPHFTLVNLAVGGQNTYHIQPTGFTPPANRPAPVEGKNITAALALQPNAIVVNMPSNDTAANVTTSEQLANFERVADLANAAHVLLWVTTTQPRDFGNAAQITEQQQVRDAILTSYAPRTLDFWTPFATAEGKTKPEYGAGDGIHLNDAAHAILLDIVVAAQIPQTVRQTPH
jgi:lysophospholipase L1-like esterase